MMSAFAYRRRARAFTLIELMTVVAIVGVLAVLGVVSYRKFMDSAHTSEAIYMVGSIRSAEESYRAETLTYLPVSNNSNSFYPSTSPGRFKTAWDAPGHADAAQWKQLGARSDGPVMYGYKVWAGTSIDKIPEPDTEKKPTWPTPTEPWYWVEAQGDINEDGTKSYVLGSSFTGDLYVEREGE